MGTPAIITDRYEVDVEASNPRPPWHRPRQRHFRQSHRPSTKFVLTSDSLFPGSMSGHGDETRSVGHRTVLYKGNPLRSRLGPLRCTRNRTRTDRGHDNSRTGTRYASRTEECIAFTLNTTEPPSPGPVSRPCGPAPTSTSHNDIHRSIGYCTVRSADLCAPEHSA